MNCDIVKVEAGSDEWLALRRGRLTASHAGDWMAKPTTKRYQNFMTLKVLELLGYEPEEEDAPWFQHGTAMEPMARAAYEFKTDIETTDNVFLIHPEHDWLGASPDGVWLPDYDGMIEIKSRLKLPTYINKIAEEERTGKIEAVYRPQVQCQMLVSGLDAIDFVNYYHDDQQRIRKLHITTVERDQPYIDRLETAAMEFMIACYRKAELYPKLRRKEQ